jgi:AmmeMemoRadiSam system protein A
MTMKFSVKESSKDTLGQLIQEIEQKYLRKREEGEDIYIRLARESLTHYLISGDYMEVPLYVTEEMIKSRRGVFVSIKKNRELRGCIGTILPTTENIAQEIIRNAVEAGIYDPRFSPVEEDELPELDLSVDVLTKPEKASREELDPKRYGVIVRSGFKTGLLLPDLEGVDTVDEQLNIALQKAGISPNENYTIEKFEVIRHSKDK